MKTTKDNAWLSRQISSAQESLGAMPDRVQKAARFEGDNHHQFRGVMERLSVGAIQVKGSKVK